MLRYIRNFPQLQEPSQGLKLYHQAHERFCGECNKSETRAGKSRRRVNRQHLFRCVEMSKPETTLVGFNDWCGQNLWEPLSRDVRTYFEGPEATRLPNPFERSLPERPWSMEYEDYWIAFGSAVLISVLSVLVGQCILQVSLNACPFDNQELTLNRYSVSATRTCTPASSHGLSSFP